MKIKTMVHSIGVHSMVFSAMKWLFDEQRIVDDLQYVYESTTRQFWFSGTHQLIADDKQMLLCSLHSTTAIAWRHIYTCRPRKITVAALFSSSDIFFTGIWIIEKRQKIETEQKYDVHTNRSSIIYILQYCKLIFIVTNKKCYAPNPPPSRTFQHDMRHAQWKCKLWSFVHIKYQSFCQQQMKKRVKKTTPKFIKLHVFHYWNRAFMKQVYAQVPAWHYIFFS